MPPESSATTRASMNRRSIYFPGPRSSSSKVFAAPTAPARSESTSSPPTPSSSSPTKIRPVELEPHERHVLQLADGKRTVFEICQESEIGEAETRKVLHTFLAIRTLKSRGPKQTPLQQTLNDGQDYAAVVDLYNEMYRNLFRHMSNEVGPIAEIILEKYLKELKERPGSPIRGVCA